jgi:signal transduction histidine kinase
MRFGTSKKKLLERIDYLEENRRFIQNSLEMVLSLSDFQENIGKRFDPVDVLKEAEKRMKHLIPFEGTALYLVSEENSEFVLRRCCPDPMKPFIENEVDFMIEKGLFGWALQERRGTFIPSRDHARQFLVHVIATYSRIRGMFVGLIPDQADRIPDTSLSLTSIILLNTANALESIELYRLMHDQNTLLEKKVEERTNKIIDYERKLQKIQKMEAIGTLAGGVAHDLNNILAGIVGYPELLLLQLPRESPLRKPLLTMQETGKKAAAIVEDMLTLARRGVEVCEVVKLNDIILDYLKSPECERLLSYHPNVEIVTKLSSHLSNITGSPVHLGKTLMNLISNAAEAMSEKGKIVISTENRYVAETINGYEDIEPGDYIIMRIADTGSGISPEDMEKIFEPFYTKKKMGRSGTGLGMAVVWGTVKDHEGYIDIDSIKGKGTSFTMYFPVTKGDVRELPTTKKIEEYMGSGESILIVDDVKEQREIADSILTTLGYASKTVSNGEDALNYIKQNPVDLVVLDMILDHGISGREIYEKILEMYPNQKAVIASGFSETEDVKITRQLGAGRFIKKPYTMEVFGTAIRAELEK